MNRLTAPAYDRFKTIVALILAAILLLMLLGGYAAMPSSPAPIETAVADPTETTLPSPAPTETITASPIPAAVKVTATPDAAAATPTLKATEPAGAISVPASPTAEGKSQATPAQTQTGSCPTGVASRLSVGQTARVLRRLNLRSEASIDAPILQTNPVGSQVEIIGGPICTPVGARAYQWWQIRLADGTEGWSAESPLKEAVYFLEPLP